MNRIPSTDKRFNLLVCTQTSDSITNGQYTWCNKLNKVFKDYIKTDTGNQLSSNFRRMKMKMEDDHQDSLCIHRSSKSVKFSKKILVRASEKEPSMCALKTKSIITI